MREKTPKQLRLEANKLLRLADEIENDTDDTPCTRVIEKRSEPRIDIDGNEYGGSTSWSLNTSCQCSHCKRNPLPIARL